MDDHQTTYLTNKIVEKKKEKGKKNTHTLFMKKKHVGGGYITKFMNIIIIFHEIPKVCKFSFWHKILGIIRKSGAFRVFGHKTSYGKGVHLTTSCISSHLYFLLSYGLKYYHTRTHTYIHITRSRGKRRMRDLAS